MQPPYFLGSGSHLPDLSCSYFPVEELQVRPLGQRRLEDPARQGLLPLLDRPVGQADDPPPLPGPHLTGQVLEQVETLLLGDDPAQDREGLLALVSQVIPLQLVDLSPEVPDAEVRLARRQALEVALDLVIRQPVVLPDQEVEQVREEDALVDPRPPDGDLQVGGERLAEAHPDRAVRVVGVAHQFDHGGHPAPEEGLGLGILARVRERLGPLHVAVQRPGQAEGIPVRVISGVLEVPLDLLRIGLRRDREAAPVAPQGVIQPTLAGRVAHRLRPLVLPLGVLQDTGAGTADLAPGQVACGVRRRPRWSAPPPASRPSRSRRWLRFRSTAPRSME